MLKKRHAMFREVGKSTVTDPNTDQHLSLSLSLSLSQLGATFDHDRFIPHVTLSYRAGAQPTSVYDGPLVFGPEQAQALDLGAGESAAATQHPTSDD